MDRLMDGQTDGLMDEWMVLFPTYAEFKGLQFEAGSLRAVARAKGGTEVYI